MVLVDWQRRMVNDNNMWLGDDAFNEVCWCFVELVAAGLRITSARQSSYRKVPTKHPSEEREMLIMGNRNDHFFFKILPFLDKIQNLYDYFLVQGNKSKIGFPCFLKFPNFCYMSKLILSGCLFLNLPLPITFHVVPCHVQPTIDCIAML